VACHLDGRVQERILGGIVAPEAVPETAIPGNSVHVQETTPGGIRIAGQGADPEIVPGNKEMRLLQESVHALEIETTPGGIVAPEAALKIAPGDKPAKTNLQGSAQAQEIIPEGVVSLEAVPENALGEQITKTHHPEAAKNHVLARGLVLKTERAVRILLPESHPQMLPGEEVHLQFLRGK